MKRSSYLFILFIALIALGVLVLNLWGTKQHQEVRQKAAVPNAPASFILDPGNTYTVGHTVTIHLAASIPSLAVDGFQVMATISGPTLPNISWVSSPPGGMSIQTGGKFTNEAHSKIFRLLYLTQNPQIPIRSTSILSLGYFRFTPTSPGTMTISFDHARTIIAQTGTAQDVVGIPQDQTYIFVKPASN